MTYNKIHETLMEMSEKQGWNEHTRVFLLCNFIEDQANKSSHVQAEPENRFQEYLQEAADAENEEANAVCENCGNPCDFESELCDDCEDSL